MRASFGSQRSSFARRPHSQRSVRARRGAALMIVIMFSVAGSMLALTAIAATSNATLVAKSYARENDLRSAADAALAIGKARIIRDPRALPDAGYATLLRDFPLTAADGRTVRDLTVNVWAGPTRSAGDEPGRFVSIVAEVRDQHGNTAVRRLELEPESFAKFAYWSNDQVRQPLENYGKWSGPVWSNDAITVGPSSAGFLDDVASAQTITGAPREAFARPVRENQPPMTLPKAAQYLPPLAALAEQSGWKFVPTLHPPARQMRIEFLTLDLNNDGDSTDANEGFFKVFEPMPSSEDWLLGRPYHFSYPVSNVGDCGDWHRTTLPGGAPTMRFYPVSAHNLDKSKLEWIAGGMNSTVALQHMTASTLAIMSLPGARCYLPGDPHLRGDPRLYSLQSGSNLLPRGGDDTTFINFTASVVASNYSGRGRWLGPPGQPSNLLRAKRPRDAQYLFPLDASPNGVIYFDNRVAVSGVVRGRVTLVAASSIQILDDLVYAGGSGGADSAACADVIGLVAPRIEIPQSALTTPQAVASSATRGRTPDDSRDLHIHGVLFASYTIEVETSWPVSTTCEGRISKRGCLYLRGGLIQALATGLNPNGEGFEPHLSYDRCAALKPPPYFPMTGRFAEKGLYEVGGVAFSAEKLFRALAPR